MGSTSTEPSVPKTVRSRSHQSLRQLAFVTQDGSSLVTNAALRRPPKATPASSVGLHNSLAGTAVGGFHRCGGGQLLPAVGRCNRREFVSRQNAVGWGRPKKAHRTTDTVLNPSKNGRLLHKSVIRGSVCRFEEGRPQPETVLNRSCAILHGRCAGSGGFSANTQRLTETWKS